MPERTIEIIFAGVDNVSKTVAKIGDTLEGVGNDIKSVADPFAGVADNILKFEAALGALAAGGIVVATQKAGELKSGIAEINTLLGLGSSELDKYSADVQKYAQDSTQSVEQILKSLYNASSLGVSYSDSLNVVGAAEKLAVGGKAELNASLETLIGTMNAYGAPMKEISNYSDTFFTIIKDGKTTLPELAASISGVTGIANAAKVPFETLGAGIAALTASGAPTAQAVTQIRAAIEGMLAPTEAAKKAAKELGIDLSESALKSKGFPALLKEIYDRTGGSAEKISTMITSTEALQAVLNLGADSAGVFAKAISDMGNKTGATEKAFAIMKDNINLTWQKMVNNFDVMLQDFGLKLGGSSADIVKSFTELWKSISTSVDAGTFDPIFDAVNSVMKGTADAVNDFAKNLPEALEGVDFSGFVKSLNDLLNQVKEFFGFDFSSSSGIKDTIQTIIDSFSALNKVTEGIIIALAPVKDAFIGLISTMKGMAPEDIAKTTGEFLGLAKAFSLVGGAIIVGGELLSGIAALSTILAPGGLLVSSIGGVVALLTGPVGLAVGLGVAAAAVLKFSTSAMTADLEQNRKKILEHGKDLESVLKKMDALPPEKTLEVFVKIDEGDIAGARRLIDELVSEENTINLKTELEAKETEEFLKNWDTLSEQNTVNLTAAINAGETEEVRRILTDLAEGRIAEFAPRVDTVAKTQMMEELSVISESGKRYSVMIPVSVEGFETAKKKIEEIPNEKILEIRLKGDIDAEILSISTRATTLQKAFEFQASVDIAEIEAAARVASAAFDAVGESVSSVSDGISSMFASLADGIAGGMSQYDKYGLETRLDRQEEQQKRLIDSQIELTSAQTKFMEAKARMLRDGEALIKLNVDPGILQPALEMIFWNVMELAQVRIKEEQADFLMSAGVV